MMLAARTEAEMFAWITQIELMTGCRPSTNAKNPDSKPLDDDESFTATINVGSELKGQPGPAENVGKRWNKFMHAMNRTSNDRVSTGTATSESSAGTLKFTETTPPSLTAITLRAYFDNGISDDPDDLCQVLHDPMACKIFKKFVEAEHSVENLLFWMEVRRALLHEKI